MRLNQSQDYIGKINREKNFAGGGGVSAANFDYLSEGRKKQSSERWRIGWSRD